MNGQTPALNARNMNAIVESINTMQTQLANPFTYKGVKATVSNLPSSGNTINDTWYVTSEGCLYSWNGTAWGVSSLSESDYLTILQQVLSDIAPAYDSTATYAVGDYCIYNNVLYRCKTAITVAEAWTAGHWTATSIGADIGTALVGYDGTVYPSIGEAVREQVGSLVDAVTVNEYYNDIWAVGSINSETGAATSATNFIRSPFYSIEDAPFGIAVADGYVFLVFGYAGEVDNRTYLGYWRNGAWSKASGPLPYYVSKLNMSPIKASGATFFRLAMRRISGEDMTADENSNLEKVLSLPEKNEAKLNNLNDYNLWNYGSYMSGFGLNSQTGNVTSNADYDTTDYIPVTPGDIIYGYGARFWCYDADKVRISGKTGVLSNLPTEIGFSQHYYVIPENAAYFRICANKTNGTAKFLAKVNAYEYWLYSQIPPAPQSRTLYTLGASITRGMFAEKGAASSSGPTPYGYPYWIGQINGYTVVNLGNSGSGWANVGTPESADDPSTAKNAVGVVDSNTFEDADIITLDFGTNDWKGASQNVVLGDMSSPVGDGTVIGNMKYCIEALTTKNPTAQIIVLLPLNTNRQWSGMATMTVEDNWAFGYPYRNNQTLEDYRRAIRTCAEYYNVKVVDLEEVCPINRLNIRSVCGDGLHPTKAFYKQMGMALAPLIH